MTAKYARVDPPALMCACGYPVSDRDRKAGKRVCLWCRTGVAMERCPGPGTRRYVWGSRENGKGRCLDCGSEVESTERGTMTRHERRKV